MKQLRPYQQKSIEAVNEALSRGVTRQILALATGTGKTHTAVQICKSYKRVLWVTHTEELLHQSSIAFIREYFDSDFADKVDSIGIINYVKNKNYFNGFEIGIIKSDLFQPYGNLVLASAATLHRRLDKLEPEMFDIIVIDECHLAAANTWIKFINFFSPKLLLGLSASPTRTDGLQLSNIFQEIVYEYGIKEGVTDGYLCELDAVKIATSISLDKVRTLGGEFNQQDLSNEINTPQRNQLVVSSYLKYAKGRQGIFFCVNIDHAIKLAEIFNEMGIICKAVSGDDELTPNRSKNIQDFKNGKIEILTNCMVLTAGFDVPNIGVIGHASPTKSLTKYLQCTGRGTRLKNADFVSKFGQNCILLDFIDSTTRHNLVNAWELDKGLPPEDRVFITQEKRDKLIADRLKKAMAKITHVQEKDERVSLLQLPKIKIIKSFKMSESATEAQLKVIERWGYSLDVHYTKQQVSDIFSQQAASAAMVKFLSDNKYDVKDRFVSVAEAMAASNEIKNRK